MKTFAEILFDALKADETLMALIGNRIVSTCFEVPPYETDNTELPNIIITDDGFTANESTKDYVWEGEEDNVMAAIDVAANSPWEVSKLVSMARQAVENYIESLYEQGEDIPTLQQGSPSSQGLDWDWEKPCYHQAIVYQAIMPKYIYNDEQEEN